MNRRYKKTYNSQTIKEKLYYHIENNLKEYCIISIIFIIGILAGVLFINNISENQKIEITSYISTFVTNLKDNYYINEIELLIESAKRNTLLATFLWFMSSTIVGIFIVYLTICFRGFCLGYTISSIILSFGTREGNFIFNFIIIIAKYSIYTCNNRINC